MDPIDEIRMRQRITVAGRARKMLPFLIIVPVMIALWLIFGG